MEDIKTKAHRLITIAIVEASKTKDLIYYAKLNAAMTAVYDAFTLNNLQNIVTAVNELEKLIKPDRHYGKLII